jgi:putative molybdopterin biosynthesis protein
MDTTFYTVDEIAEKLAVSKYAVREWIKAGELQAYKFGKSYRISEEMFQNYLEKKKTH